MVELKEKGFSENKVEARFVFRRWSGIEISKFISEKTENGAVVERATALGRAIYK